MSMVRAFTARRSDVSRRRGRRMRILWLSHFLPYPPVGGAPQRSYHLIRETSREHEVHLVALVNPALHPTDEAVQDAVRNLEDVCASVNVFRKPTDASRLRWALMTGAAFFRKDPWAHYWLWSPTARKWLEDIRSVLDVDVVQVDSLGLTRYLDSAPEAPFFLTHHNVESDLMQRRADHERRWAPRRYFRREVTKLVRAERTWAPRASLNLVVSELDADRLRAVAQPVRVKVIENGVDVSYFKPARTPVHRRNAVFVGGMTRYANRDAVLHFFHEVWPLLRADDARRTWTVVGSDPPRELADARHAGVIAPGFVHDARPLMDAAEIYVCPVRDGGGTRLKILDALAMAKPLVATPFSAEGLELVPGEHFLPAETPEEFLQAFRRLEGDDELRRRLSVRGRELVCERYAWEVIGAKLRGAFEAVLEAS